ncbi:MAG: FAD binding domain-containing protein, partial [Acidimicrobiales bacterium]
MTIALTLDDACAALAADPTATVLAGGTDLMVQVNRGDLSIGNVVAIDRVPELRGWTREGDVLRIGAGMTYAEMADPGFGALAPALGQAARTVGSPQIRATGT